MKLKKQIVKAKRKGKCFTSEPLKYQLGDIHQQGKRWIRFYLLSAAFNNC